MAHRRRDPLGPCGADVLAPADLADRLLPNLTLPTVQRVDDEAALIGQLEAEISARTRRLRDAPTYRTRHPEDPLPLTLAVIEDTALRCRTPTRDQ